MYYSYTNEDLKGICRNTLDSLEKWLKELIIRTFTDTFGDDFYNIKLDGNDIIARKVKEDIENRMKNNNKIKSPISAMYLGEVRDILIQKRFYNKIFKNVFNNDNMDKRILSRYLDKLINIRNDISHAREISVRDAEKCICYSNDIIDEIKCFYKRKGSENMFNAPTIIAFQDSLGMKYEVNEHQIFIPIGQRENENHIFHCGDTYWIEVIVDSSFEPSEYTIDWNINSNYNMTEHNKRLNITIDKNLIGPGNRISCTIISKKDWHLRRDVDDFKQLRFAVAPI